jgi:PleD family two-component response regulator
VELTDGRCLHTAWFLLKLMVSQGEHPNQRSRDVRRSHTAHRVTLLEKRAWKEYNDHSYQERGIRMKRLLVDTDCDRVEMLTNWFKTGGFEVSHAFTGERACREWEQQQPDLVIIDPTLKDMDGLRVVRQMSAKHDALVLVITNSKDVNDEIRC